jgi:hypothetical protein
MLCHSAASPPARFYNKEKEHTVTWVRGNTQQRCQKQAAPMRADTVQSTEAHVNPFVKAGKHTTPYQKAKSTLWQESCGIPWDPTQGTHTHAHKRQTGAAQKPPVKHTHTHTYTHTHTHKHTHTRRTSWTTSLRSNMCFKLNRKPPSSSHKSEACMYSCVRTSVCLCAHVFMCAQVCVYVCVFWVVASVLHLFVFYVCVCVCVFVCVCTCVCVRVECC